MAIIISVLLHCLVFDYYNNVFINIFVNKVYFLKIDLAINTHTYIYVTLKKLFYKIITFHSD